jgi:hypothetical protein
VLVRLEKSGVFDEVADAIPGQRHFRRHEEVGPLLHGGVERSENLCGVAVDVTTRRVQLGERDAHGLYRSISHHAGPAKTTHHVAAGLG